MWFPSAPKFALVIVGLILAGGSAHSDPLALEIQRHVAPVLEGEKKSVDRSDLDAAALVPRIYERREYRPAWNTQKAVDELFAELNQGISQGFRPQDFGLDRLRLLYDSAKSGSLESKAAFDVAATDSAVILVHHMVFGKVDPAALDADWNFSKPVIEQDPVEVLNRYLDGDGFSALMSRIAIDNPQYRQLVDALATYRKIAAKGGWPTVPDDTVLKPGMVAPAVAVVRQRLAAEAALQAGQILPDTEDDTDPRWVYDKRLEQDVKAFQARHGLEDDGAIGPRTFASLNRSVEERLDQLRLSLERGRWLLRDLEGDFILVNIAGARTYLIKSDDTMWITRSITGSQYRKTPVFRDEIKYMEFNPTWTVPVSIFKKDKLPRIRKDPAYLERNNFIVRNGNGDVVRPDAVNWNANNPGVTLVQRPGPDNALGLVKFMFPNKYSVYLHDTNNRNLFDRNERNLSSGCVRVEYPFDLANLLMEGAPDWSAAKLQEILDSGATTRINLPEPVPVLLTYWTAWVENGVVHFREDPYDRDRAILAALNR